LLMGTPESFMYQAPGQHSCRWLLIIKVIFTAE